MVFVSACSLALIVALVLHRASSDGIISLEPGESVHNVTVHGLSRRYKLYVPPTHDPHVPIELWVMCPGTGDTPDQLIVQTGPTGMVSFALQKGFAFAALEGESLSMNVEAHGQGLPWRPDDVEYTMAVLKDVGKKVTLDMERIRCAGFSRGARFCSRLASELGSYFSAIAPVSGIRFPLPNNATRPMPIIAFHGTADQINPFNGNGNPYWHESVPDAIQHWAEFNGCTRKEQTVINKVVTVFKHTHCQEEADVFLVQVEGGGHTWPGSLAPTSLGLVSHDINANVDMYNFFKWHRLDTCQTAKPGSKCHHHVLWAKHHGIHENAGWYPGLNPQDSFETFQAFLRKEFLEDCPMPCTTTTTTTTTATTTTITITTTSTTLTTITSTTSTTTLWTVYDWIGHVAGGEMEMKTASQHNQRPLDLGSQPSSRWLVVVGTVMSLAAFAAVVWKVRSTHGRQLSRHQVLLPSEDTAMRFTTGADLEALVDARVGMLE